MGLLAYQIPFEVISKMTIKEIDDWVGRRIFEDDYPGGHPRLQSDIQNLVTKACCTDIAQREVQEKALSLLRILDEELDVRKEWNIADYYFCLADKVIKVPSRPDAPPFDRSISPEERIMGFIIQYRAIMAVWKAARVAVDQKQSFQRGCEVTTEPGRFIVSDPEFAVEQELSESESSEEESVFERIETELNDAVGDLETALKSGSEAVTSTGQALASLYQLLVEAYIDGNDKWPFVKAAKFVLDVPETPSTFSDILTHRFSASLRTRES